MRIITTILLLLSVMLSKQATAQSNPFDMAGRKATSTTTPVVQTPPPAAPPVAKPVVVPPSVSAATTQVAVVDTSRPATTPTVASTPGASSPFDIAPHSNAVTSTSNNNVISSSPAPTPFEKAPIVQTPTVETPAPVVTKQLAAPKQQNFVFWTILVMLLLLTVAVALNRNVISDTFEGFRSENSLKTLHKDLSAINRAAYYTLYLLCWLNCGIFIFLLMSYMGVATPFSNFQTMLLCILGASLIFSGKHLLLWLIENIFPLAKEMKQYSFTIMIFGIVLGLILAPLNIFIAYVPDNLISKLIWTSLIIIGLVYIYRSTRSLIIAAPYLGTNIFQFLLYLCAVEIAPLAIITRMIMSN